MNWFRFFWHFPRNILIKIIRIYQRTLSPDHSAWGRRLFSAGYCKFSPSCSEYFCQALQKQGLIYGILKGMWRIFRCNPWGKGGKDLA